MIFTWPHIVLHFVNISSKFPCITSKMCDDNTGKICQTFLKAVSFFFVQNENFSFRQWSRKSWCANVVMCLGLWCWFAWFVFLSCRFCSCVYGVCRKCGTYICMSHIRSGRCYSKKNETTTCTPTRSTNQHETEIKSRVKMKFFFTFCLRFVFASVVFFSSVLCCQRCFGFFATDHHCRYGRIHILLFVWLKPYTSLKIEITYGSFCMWMRTCICFINKLLECWSRWIIFMLFHSLFETCHI